MRYVRLGSTGLKVSVLCLGTMTFGKQTNEKEAHRILSAAIDAGVNFVDTANVYPQGGDFSTVGATESILGRYFKERRSDVIIATKAGNPTGPNSWDRGGSRKHILDAIDGSLRRLNVDYVDLFQLHQADSDTPLEETLMALDAVVTSGKARYVGVSNWQAWQVALALGRSDRFGRTKICTVQPRYNLLFRENERELFPLCVSEGLGVMAYNPLAGGLLSGKHQQGGAQSEPAEGTRFALPRAGERYRKRYWHAEAFETVSRLRDLANRISLPLPTMALSWVLAKPAVTVAVVGASAADQLRVTLNAADATLDGEVLQEMDSLTSAFRKGDELR